MALQPFWTALFRFAANRTFGTAAGLFLLACVLSPTQAFAHLGLQKSAPAQGDTVRESLTEIRLSFTQAVEARYTSVVLLDNTNRPLALGTLLPVGSGRTRHFVYRLTHPLVSGDFVVRWRTAGADGHVVSGSFDFTVAVPDALTVTPAAPAPSSLRPTQEHDHHVAGGEVEPLYRPESLLWVLARWVNFAGLLLMVGAVGFRFGVLERSRNLVSAEVAAPIDLSTRRMGLVAAAIALAGNAVRLWLQTGSLHGSERLWEPELLRPMLLETGWGKAWIAQTVAVLAFAVAVRLRTQKPLESWIAAAIFAVVAASTPAFAGHAAAVEQMAVVPIVNDAIHVVAASAWLGTLAVLLFAAMPPIVRHSRTPFADAAVLVRTFSPLALFAAAVAVATGTFSAFVHIQAISELWTTPYGRTLAIKLAAVMLTGTTGAYNWKVVTPGLGTEAATLHIRRSALAEIIIAAAILGVTAVLVALPIH